MSDKPMTLVVSDLHVGGGPADAGDDHIDHKGQFVAFLRDQLRTPEGRAGDIELFFNGDFLEFAQTDTQAFTLVSEDCWCNQEQSMRKLDTIIAGHPDVFEVLRAFQRAGNEVTIAAGNHDVDLYWPGVQRRLRETAGQGLRIQTGQEWIARHEGRLQIGHGHMSDPANRFRDWSHPVVTARDGTQCLEMCPGTLFMVKFVNGLEARYPFADNLLPVSKLAAVLLADDKAGFAAMGWMFMKLFATTSMTTLEATADSGNYGEQMLRRLGQRGEPARRVAAALEEIGEIEWSARVAAGHLGQVDLAGMMFSLLGRIDIERWQTLLALPPAATLSPDNGVTLSAIVKSSFVDGKQDLRRVAGKRAQMTRAQVIVMGHTHQPDSIELDEGGRYYNPGSWTRYLELQPGQRVTLDELKQEERYPYCLNAVRVLRGAGGLESEVICVDRG